MTMDRFERHYRLKGFGKEGQQKLTNASVLIIGAGGLGCPALIYLSAAGIGKIGICDGDIVSESNLSRQVIFGESQVGINKAVAAADFLKSRYSDIQFQVIPKYLNQELALEIISQYDLIIDGSDNFPTRYLVNDACYLLDKPLIYGGIHQNEGQIALFNSNGRKSCNYRDLFPKPPSSSEVPNCNTTGVLGVLPGIIGTMQATEAIKFLSGYGQTLEDKLLIYNLINHHTFEMQLYINPDGRNNIPENKDAFLRTDYQQVCGNELTVSWPEVIQAIQKHPDVLLLDVRDEDERPKLALQHKNIPLDTILREPFLLSEFNPVYLFCQSGIRSQKAAEFLQKTFPGKSVYSVIGGTESNLCPK